MKILLAGKISMTILFFFFSVFVYSQEDLRYKLLFGSHSDYHYQPYKRYYGVYHAGLGHQSRTTTVIVKINSGHTIISEDGGHKSPSKIQYEGELYQKLSRNHDLWLNYAHSSDEMFPRHRLMFTVWQKLPEGFLVQGGMKYFQFSEDEILLYQAGVERYMGDYWLEFVTLASFDEGSPSFSYFLSGRWFFEEPNYIQLTLGTGTSTSDFVSLHPGIDKIRSHSARLHYVNDISYELKIRTGFTYAYEEHLPSQWRSRFTLGVGFEYKF